MKGTVVFAGGSSITAVDPLSLERPKAMAPCGVNCLSNVPRLSEEPRTQVIGINSLKDSVGTSRQGVGFVKLDEW
jgi:hypothetical protein